jgi:hypothetical protein
MKQLFLVATIAFTTTGFAQKVNNKLTFQKGQKLEMISKVNSIISMEMMGQAMETKVDATITRLFDVEDVTNNGATIEHKVKRIQMNVEAPMQGAQTFDSDIEKDMKGDGGKAMEKALKNNYSMTVDAGGKITAVKADDANPNNSPKKEDLDMMSNALAQFAAGFDLPKTGDTSEFMILPSKELAKGESWTDSSKNVKTVYILADVTDADIIVNYTEEASTSRTQEAMGQEIIMTSKDKTTGKITLDKKSGLLKEKTATINSEGNMEMAGQTMPMNTKTTKTVTVKAI